MNKAIMAGGRRIKRRKRKGNHLSVANDDEKHYIKAVNNFNDIINKMKDGEYIKFRDFSTRIIESVSNELKRNDFTDRNAFRVFKENRLMYLFKNLFYPENRTKILLQNDNYDYIQSTFYNTGIAALERMIVKLQESVTQKTYVQTDPAKEYNKELFDEKCKILDIEPMHTKMTFSYIKEKYNIKLETVQDNVEEKIVVNNAFITIRNQYDNYLNSFIELDETLLEGTFDEVTRHEAVCAKLLAAAGARSRAKELVEWQQQLELEMVAGR